MSSNIIQPMPELAPEQLDALWADIAANGVMQPVVVDQHGRILDGNHRAAIAQELGLDYPTVVVTVEDDADAWDRAVTLNCARRHMTREQVREVIKGEIRRTDDSDRAIARRVGCSPSTVGSVRTELREWAEELTERIRKTVDEMYGQVILAAARAHKDGAGWRDIADYMERGVAAEWRNEETSDPDPATVWNSVIKPMFDHLRKVADICDCRRCVSVVSNLDTEAVAK